MLTGMSGLAFFLSAASVPLAPATATTPEAKLAMGYKVKDRQVQAQPADHVYHPGETVVAWTEVVGIPTGFVEHVWFKGDTEVARHYLPVANGRRWRTWSRHKVTPGTYRVEILGPDRSTLTVARFTVEKGE
jgi:hypothetical protein